MPTKQQLFSDAITKWTKKTWAGWWKIDIQYFTDKQYHKEKGLSAGSVAVCHTDWRYMTAVIRVNLDRLKEMEKSEIEYAALHELMHIFLNEMREEGIGHEERVATFLARSFLLAGGE